MFHEKIEEHCENVINKLADWLNGANSIQWYDYDIYGNSDENHCYQMLKSMLFLSFNFNTKYHDVLIDGHNSYKYYHELKDVINDFDKTFVISYVKILKLQILIIRLSICTEKKSFKLF